MSKSTKPRDLEDVDFKVLDRLADEGLERARRAIRNFKQVGDSHFGIYPPAVHAATALAEAKRAMNISGGMMDLRSGRLAEKMESAALELIKRGSCLYALASWLRGERSPFSPKRGAW